MLALASFVSLNAAAQHAHGGTTQECSCAQHEPDHPFTINCESSGQQAIRDATVMLETTCSAASSYEWGGAFATPANGYKWVSQAVTSASSTHSSGRAYADPTMPIVVFSLHSADKEHLLEKATAAATLMADAASCTVVNDNGNIPVPTDAGACYTLTFPTDPTDDFNANVDTTGVSSVAFFTGHGPTEFEFDMHYFMSTDLATDIEPAPAGGGGCSNALAVTDGKEYDCKYAPADAAGIKQCAKAFYIIQAHHDYCPHDTLTRYEEELFHTWESKCHGCNIVRKYDASLNACPVIDCLDTTVASLGYNHLQENCVAADTTYPFEWAAIMTTSANAYTWVSQAATPGGAPSVPTNYSYADAEMKIVAIKMDNTARSTLFGKQDTADALMTNGPCPVVTATCAPGVASCGSAPNIVPTTTGACYTVQFPISNVTLVDFHANFDTSNAGFVAIFTAHMPTEFERDTHYFMSTDLATDVEPTATLGAAAAHDHGRRMSEVSAITGNDRRSRRRLANSGSCCNNATQRGAWKQVVAYHDLCNHCQVPSFIEVGFHDYEASCENYFCNLIGPNIDQTVCPFPPPSPPLAPPAVSTSSTGIEEGTLIGVIVAAVVVLLFFVAGICYMVNMEKKGKPIFTNMIDAKGAA